MSEHDNYWHGEADRLRKALEDLKSLYQEKRSDVSDICETVLEGGEVVPEWAEDRYVSWEYGGTKFLYDTLTTLVEVEFNGRWDLVDDVKYSGDDDDKFTKLVRRMGAKKPKPKIYMNIEGGTIQVMFADTPIDVMIVDEDLEAGPEDVSKITDRNGRAFKCFAFIQEPKVDKAFIKHYFKQLEDKYDPLVERMGDG